jgi:TonB-dependent receptor-like protein
MKTPVPFGRAAPTALLLIATLVMHAALVAAQQGGPYKGKSLADALRALQARGLQIVFTSATVKDDMRVEVEPHARTLRQILDELLAPHGLKARDGPGAIVEVVRAEVAQPRSRTAVVGTVEGTGVDAAANAPVSPAASVHREYVTVTRPAPYRKDRGVASETSLDRTEWTRLYGSLADDPVRVVHALPRVTPVDDFRSEFAVRGSPFRHINFVVDGVSTHWLQHTAYNRGATGSVAMLPALVVEDATLRAGAYPRRNGDRLGPEVDLTIREGSRTDFRLRGAVGGTTAALLGEGPMGSSAHGSWLVAFRQSYLEWPTERPESTRTPFGFFDGVAKFVYDVRSSQRVALSVLGGTATIDGNDDMPASELGDGSNRALAVNFSWRSSIGPTGLLTQRVSVVRHHFLNMQQTGHETDHGANEEAGYRVDLTHPIARGLLEAGAQIGRTAIDDLPRRAGANPVAAASWARSGYAHLTWPITPTLTLSPGMRVTSSTLVPQRAIARWLLGEWAFRPRWAINASVGVAQQLPELRHVIGGTAAPIFGPERARHVDVAIEQQITSALRWQATVFSRMERNILREPDIDHRLVDGIIVPPERQDADGLEGSSRGIELLLDRRSAGAGLAAWAAYAYGKTRYTDTGRREWFWGDFDQRHALTLFGRYPFARHASVGATFRAGSNFPIPGYLAVGPHGLVVGAERNRVRLPAYARLDVRADREFERFGRRVTIFGEVLNLLDRPNAGLTGGSINTATGETTGFTDALFRRRVSAGVVVEF